MKNPIDLVLKVILTLILILPVVGALGVMPAPTRNLYNSDQAFQFISIMMASRYISIMMAVVFVLALYLMWTRRVPVAMMLILPVTLNIVGFHAFLDGGLITPGAAMGNILLFLNLYFLWRSRAVIGRLLDPEPRG